MQTFLKTLLFICATLFCTLVMTSCETQLPEEGTWSKEPQPTITYQLSLNKTTIVAKTEGSSEAFNITSDDSWTVSVSDSWIKVSDASGFGDKTLTVIVEANTSKDARTGSISIKGKSSGTKTISVSQTGKEYSLVVDKSEISVGAAEATEAFSITSNDSWTITSSETWVKLSDESGDGNKTITVTISANTSVEARIATITVTGKDSGQQKTIIVSQEGKVFTLSIDKTEISVGSSSTFETFSITSDDSWTATTDASWLALSATSGSGDMTITVTINLNSTSTSRTGTITVKGSNSGTKTISVAQKGKPAIDTNGYEYVDLGLPSGLLWATCNVGASSSEDSGDYFAWGATYPQSVYNWVNTPYQTQNTTELTETRFTKYLGSISSYCIDSSAKDFDALKTVLDPDDDAAHVNWGGRWRMPTYDELYELQTQCTWTMTTQKGVKGCKVSSNNNNNSIFLPAAGSRFGSTYYNEGTRGYYWSSSLYTSEPYRVYCLYFDSEDVGKYYYYRLNGSSIRPVCSPL